MRPLTATKDAIANIMRQHDVVLGYVFGSYAKQTTTPLSDVDIAVLFRPELPKQKHLQQELDLARAIRQLLRINHVDIVNLTTASDPLLRYRATINGQPVVVVNERRRLILEIQILREYEDTKRLRRTNAYYLKQRLSSAT
ncbi:MAG: hypothetical protein A3E37_03595 [Candidatus Andersenbacteria bacterium RIFCSPHIGHO2_12_FULL_46_9]|nr:MAG: Nucleotidyltransferase [Parcubacteria group bacterium GW2011_GWA2_45_14]OGY35800.1 MAG: hypothetical protein A3B76_03755 [Candidatus Andersenbacteria bacterium RIFCSPHIGHO2_02_FULL_46_16]OGY36441.1 MAG: hypothetical protein A3E37_03595 [Candidatus Andersenbacteria bacterium RIFCSPHIGHO2_12_FULL_46_9]OGY42553.1 MAG: hypothetical protein A3G57_02945 [Candidatus Andersenbacteria bacterium RIFCSPLOWO2_12_FULL_45_8]HBE90452.1 hypothetical protein [Candidatus Andersenbacteria bacterium]